MKIFLRASITLGWAWILFALGGCAGMGDLSEKRAAVVSAAQAQVGTPYKYGGNEPGRGLDCSGLTHYAYRTVGLKIPRSSVEQRLAARPVSPNAPRPGDLVFFRTGPDSHHVGLMVDSERFVHASSSAHRVGYAKLRTPYWKAHYLGAGTYLD